MARMATLAIASTKVVGDCKSERDDELNVFYERYRCRKLSESFSQRVHSLRVWASEYLHPWLLMVLLAGAETIRYMLVGIEMLPFIIVVITAMVTGFSVSILPIVLLRQLSNNEDFMLLFTAKALQRAGIFGISGVLLLFLVGWLNLCVWKMDTTLLLHKADEIFPTLGFITFFAAIELFVVYISLVGALTILVIIYVVLGFLMLVMVLSSYIPWYVLLPLTGFLLIFLIALIGQIWSSCSKSSGSTTSDQKDENADYKRQNPEDSKPQESEASELRPEV